jgi:hypothetical protein
MKTTTLSDKNGGYRNKTEDLDLVLGKIDAKIQDGINQK